jgi:DNA primase
MPFDWVRAAKPVHDADEVRSLASIVEVVGSRVPLRRKGRELVALCPFHEDSTPSMAVITHKGRGFYKCHACGAGGDAIRFVMDFDGVDFAEAVGMIAEGIALPSVPMKRPSKAPKIEEHRYREDCGEIIDAWRNATRPAHLEAAARTLGVSADALRALGFAWCPEGSGSYAFPMHDESGRVCGIRLRAPVDAGARKWAVEGSRSGVFCPIDGCGALADRVFVCEGPTDAAALLGVRDPAAPERPLAVIGRPSCSGQEEIVAKIARSFASRDAELVIVEDGDGAGRSGAAALAAHLGARFRVRTVTPPAGFKDARAWLCGRRQADAWRWLSAGAIESEQAEYADK